VRWETPLRIDDQPAIALTTTESKIIGSDWEAAYYSAAAKSW